MLARVCKVITGIALLSAIAVAANAQPPGGGGFRPRGMPGGMFSGGMGGGGMGEVFLLRSEQVQKELKLTDKQKEQLQKLAEDTRGDFRERFRGLEGLSREEREKKLEEMREEMQKEAAKRAESMKKQLAEILDQDQLKRLRQIGLQQAGPAALMQPAVAEAVGLTEKQKEEIQEIQRKTQEKSQSLWQEARGGNREDRGAQFEQLRQKSREIREEGEKQAMAVLKPEQKQKLGEMMGEPFELERPQFGRPQGGDRERGEGDRPRRGGDRSRRGNRERNT